MIVRLTIQLEHNYLEQRGRDFGLSEQALSGFKNLGSVELTYEVPDNPYDGAAQVVAVNGLAVSRDKWTVSS